MDGESESAIRKKRQGDEMDLSLYRLWVEENRIKREVAADADFKKMQQTTRKMKLLEARRKPPGPAIRITEHHDGQLAKRAILNDQAAQEQSFVASHAARARGVLSKPKQQQRRRLLTPRTEAQSQAVHFPINTAAAFPPQPSRIDDFAMAAQASARGKKQWKAPKLAQPSPYSQGRR